MLCSPPYPVKMGGASGYIISCSVTASQISSKEATEACSSQRVLVPISQGTEVTIVTEYVPCQYFTRTASSINACPIMPYYDAERLETKTHVGLGPVESVEYTKQRVSPEGHPWPGCRPISETWCLYSYGQTKQKRSLNNVGQVNLEDCFLSRKDSLYKAGTSRL